MTSGTVDYKSDFQRTTIAKLMIKAVLENDKERMKFIAEEIAGLCQTREQLADAKWGAWELHKRLQELYTPDTYKEARSAL